MVGMVVGVWSVWWSMCGRYGGRCVVGMVVRVCGRYGVRCVVGMVVGTVVQVVVGVWSMCGRCVAGVVVGVWSVW